jgi:predicted metal-dependent HD superfamily phosphohydrolase
MDYHTLLKKVEHYAIDCFENTPMGSLSYHNRHHTESVAAYAKQLALHYQLNERDYFIVIAASWLHDLGYTIDRANHEMNGAEAAGRFLTGLELPAADIDAVKGCILATKLPQNPHNLLEEIVCDADLFHWGTNHFSDLNKMMRKEYESVNHEKADKDTWRNKTISLLESHRYHTDYARMLLDDQKTKNLFELKEKSESRSKQSSPYIEPLDLPHHKQTGEKSGKSKNDRPERGVETMFRISAANHLRLSGMADNKAHIMITVNSIILSAVISILIRKLEEYVYLMIPTFLLLATSLLTIIYAILATRPTIPNGFYTKKDMEEKKINLLFFGNFYRMSLPEYKEGMEKMMEDPKYLYGSLITDGYAQGIVLRKKYRLLRLSYNAFMFGLIVSVIAFIIASAFYGKPV